MRLTATENAIRFTQPCRTSSNRPGERYELPRPFRSWPPKPVEMEGTYPLPEAQIDSSYCKIIVRILRARTHYHYGAGWRRDAYLSGGAKRRRFTDFTKAVREVVPPQVSAFLWLS